MYNVSDAVIEAYKADGVHKEFKVNLNGVDYLNDQIVADTLNIKQSILDSEQFEAIGCIASSFSIDLRAQFPTKQKGAHVKVYVKPNGVNDWMQIFDGYVDKCTKTANGWNRHIEAYDVLYNWSGQSGQASENDSKRYDITDWFNEHSDVSTYDLLSQLCSKYGVSLRTGNLPLVNGNVYTTCGRVKKASNLSALDLAKAIMQINGAFGYITGDGYFSWKYMVMHSYDEVGTLYPSAYLFPSSTLYPGTDPDQVQTKENATNFIGEYESLEYQDFKMLPIGKVKVRNYDKDETAGEYGDGSENTYIIEGNILVKDKNQQDKTEMAERIYNMLNSTWYVPFNANLPGLPYIECGDEINFWDFIEDYGHAHLQRFYVLSRTITGGQHLKDNFTAEGNEYLHEFITGQADNSSVDELKDEIDQLPTEEEVDDKIAGASGLANIVSVATYSDIPQNPDSHTLYVIQSEVMVIDSFDSDHNGTGDTAPEDEPEPDSNDPGTETEDPGTGTTTSGNRLADLDDVQITNPVANQSLKYNGTKWVNSV